MTKAISIIMATIIMLTASVNTEMLTASAATPTAVTANVKVKTSYHKNKKKKHKHSMPKGNMGKWFKSKKALRKYVNKVMKYWADKEERGEITREEYYEKCPSGYEAWSCSCGKWTGNFKYN